MSYADIHRAAGIVMTKQIFSVVGCQKSGTTWIQRILDAHRKAVCRGETSFGTVFFPAIKHLVKEFNHQQEFRNSQFGPIPPENLMNDEHVKYMFANMSAMMMSQWFDVDDPAIVAVGEKTPEHATSLPLMDAVFPGIKIINILRDPRDATVSGWFHNLRLNREKFTAHFPTMASYAAYFIEHHWLFYLDKCRTFAKTNPKQYHELRYEDLHENPSATIRDILEYLNLDSDKQTIEHCAQAGSFATITGRKQGEENRQSFFRKGITGDWRNQMDKEARNVIENMAGQQMAQLGYQLEHQRYSSKNREFETAD